MARGWIAGLLAGVVVAGLGLAVVSVVFGPVAPVAPTPVATPEEEPPAVPEAEAEPVVPDATPVDVETAVEEREPPQPPATPAAPEVAEPEIDDAPSAEAVELGDTPADMPDMQDNTPAEAPDMGDDLPADDAAPAADDTAPDAETSPQAPEPAGETAAEETESAQRDDDAAPVPAAPDETAVLPQEPDAAPAAAAADVAQTPEPALRVEEPDTGMAATDETAEAEPVEPEVAEVTPPAQEPPAQEPPSQEPPSQEPAPLPQVAVDETPEAAPAPATETETEDVAAAAATSPEPKTIIVSPEADLAPELEAKPGVVVNRLPNMSSVAEPEPEPVAAVPREPALSRNALAFAPSGTQPRLAFLLIDTGAADRARLGEIGNLPFPITVAVDASATDAQEAMAFYRDQGAEVMLEVPLPDGATPTDVDVTVEAYGPLMDQAVAVLPEEASGFQTLGAGAVQLATNLAETGHGLVSYPAGLNTGHKAAVKEGVKAGLVFRDLDAEGQGGAVIRRFLDNAAFKARGQQGVIVVARTRPETVQALLEWSLGTRAQSVALAPVSAVLAGE